MFLTLNDPYDSVNAHAEDLRSYFVAHEGKKTLKMREIGSRNTIDFAKVARTFPDLLNEHVSFPLSCCL